MCIPADSSTWSSYEGGGKPFEPFKLKTKYVDLKEEK